MRLLSILLVCCISLPVLAGEPKNITIGRTVEKAKIDGVLDEAFWQHCSIASDFIQNTPRAGESSARRTEVKIAYDDQAIYVGAVMYDDIDSMSRTFSQRDDEGNADWFSVILDPYHAGTIGFGFTVTSAGVQQDALHQVFWEDYDWNAVWQSSVKVQDDKWVAEFKIPFSALRFPEEDVQSWGVNFARNIRRHREHSYWNHYDPTGLNLLSQLGTLNGIENIDAPLRLSFTPYVSGYLQHYDGFLGRTANGGMDVKYGINNAFTLDMTLIPDFGQVAFDQQVLNLSPFEVYFNERRQFFTEGTELFNKAGHFYSRRIGGRPINSYKAYLDCDSNETVVNNPSTSPLINATKVSGRTSKGTGIGIFNALTRSQFAEIYNSETDDTREFQTSPLCNYNVFVLDQNLKNNSTVTLTNTNVLRNGETYDANLTGLNANLYTKGQKYNLYTSGSVSQKYFAPDSNSFGHNFSLGLHKSAGNLKYGATYFHSDKKYDKNDLGFQTTNNLRNTGAYVNYGIYKPFWRLLKMWTGLSINHQMLMAPGEFSSFGVNANVGGTFRNFMTAGAYSGAVPIRSRDFFEPRVAGRFYEGDLWFYTGWWISTDYSKPFSFDGGTDHSILSDSSRWAFSYRASPRLRVSDRLMIILNNDLDYSNNDEGAAVGIYGVPFDGVDPVFAKRNRLTVTNTISTELIFTNRMGITFNLRHYWSRVKYNSFYRLNTDGQFDPTTYDGDADNDGVSDHNNSFNAFTIDCAYRWIFAPGSELSLVWKNSIFTSSSDIQLDYFQNVDAMFKDPATNSLSLKILYYIDYWKVHQALFKRKEKQ